MDSQDSNKALIWGAVFSVVVLAIGLAFGATLHRDGQVLAPPGSAVATEGLGADLRGTEGAEQTATSAVFGKGLPASADAPSVRVEVEVVKFYFASGKTELAPGAEEALGSVVRGVAAGQTAVIRSFHGDTGDTGDAAQNEALAHQRAVAVRDALVSLGIGEDKLHLRPSEVMASSTGAAGVSPESRRVEVRLQ